MTINRNSPLPLYVQIKEDLKKKIVAGTFSKDGPIPSEKELMEKYSVGRATIREAIVQLAAEGYVEKKQGIGTFIKTQSRSIAFEPFISLEYALNSFGVTVENELKRMEFLLNDETFRQVSHISSDRIFYLKRCRLVDHQVVASEEFIFSSDFYEKAKNCDFRKSIGKILIEELALDIGRFTQEVEILPASEEHMAELSLSLNEQILVMKRHLFLKAESEPFQFYKLIVPLRYTAFPFI